MLKFFNPSAVESPVLAIYHIEVFVVLKEKKMFSSLTSSGK